MRLAAGLNKADYLGSLPCLFNTGEERFQQRFATLTMLNRPEPLSYSYYCRSMDMTGTFTLWTWQVVRQMQVSLSACLCILLGSLRLHHGKRYRHVGNVLV